MTESTTTETVTVGSMGTTTGELPSTVNDFTVESTSHGRVTYVDDEGFRVRVSHSTSGPHDRRGRYTMALLDEDENSITTRVIKHGQHDNRTIAEATSLIETQLWEWARYSVSDRYPVQSKIESLGEPDPHPPGEAPAVPDTWFYSYSPNYKHVDDPDRPLDHGTHVDTSRYEFKASNEDSDWYCGQVIASFNHEPPESIENDPDCVYGAYIYISLTPLKPVEERVNQYDTKEINRECVRNDAATESLEHDVLLSDIEAALDTMCEEAQAINDEDHQKIRAEANRRLNEETGEYEDQARITGF